MSQKFQLVTDDDSPDTSIKRHLGVALWLVLAPVLAIIVLLVFSLMSAATARDETKNTPIRNAVPFTTVLTAMPTRTPFPGIMLLTEPFRTTASQETNLSLGPGPIYEVVGQLMKGQAITLYAKTESGDWYKTQSGFWIAGEDLAGDLP